MQVFFDLSEDFQHIAEAISAVLELDVELVDHKLNVIAGTGIYKKRVGSREAEGYLYSRVIETKKYSIVEDPSCNPDYDPSALKGKTPETIEICCPIIEDGEVYGVIGLVGFDIKARERVLENKEKYLKFLKHMADLLASKIQRKKVITQVYQLKNRLQTIIDLLQEGVISTNEKGIIDFINKSGVEILGRKKEEVLNRKIASVLPNSSILSCLEKGEGFINREEIHRFKDKDLHLLASTKAINGKGKTIGAVSVFQQIADIKKMFYDISGKQKATHFEDIVGESRELTRVKEMAAKIAPTDTTVLILGESGTGKELFARSIHESSPRSNAPFIAINCASIPTTLLESELFGYEGGAFTGARKGGKVGKFEMADKGTVFLDEIGDMSPHLQVKLLRVLQERKIERVGGIKPIPIDVRIIAATNKNLEEMMKKGEFREDLFYRLNVIQLKIPPLRDRIGDIPLLMDYFLQIYNRRLNKNIQGFSPDAYELMVNYSWPGNVRELENAIAYAINLETDKVIHKDNLPAKLKEESLQKEKGSLKEILGKYEREIISRTLKKYEGSSLVEARQKAADELNIGIATLYRKIREYDL